jgi:hypothetical protein
VIDKDDKIVMAGSAIIDSVFQFVVLKCKPDGSPDSTFNTDGKVSTPLSTEGALAYCIAIQSDDQILAGGIYLKTGADYGDFVIVRYNGTTVGVTDPEEDLITQVYPNPSEGKFNVQLDNNHGETGSVEIFNILGEIIFETEMNTQKIEIDLGNESNGVYLLNIRTRNLSLSKKIIVHR